MGEKSPEPPLELFSPVMSPDARSSKGSHSIADVIDVEPSSPGSTSVSDSGVYVPVPLNNKTPPSSFGNTSSIVDEASTSDRVDLRSSLRSLQELLLTENFPLEISTLLYLILKDTPEPKKAYTRIVEGSIFNKGIGEAIFKTINRFFFVNVNYRKVKLNLVSIFISIT